MIHIHKLFLVLGLLLIVSSTQAQTYSKVFSQSPNPLNLKFGKDDLELFGDMLLVGSIEDNSAYLYDLQSTVDHPFIDLP